MAIGVTVASLGARSGGLATDWVSLTALAVFAAAHPAYPVAAVVAVLVFLGPK